MRTTTDRGLALTGFTLALALTGAQLRADRPGRGVPVVALASDDSSVWLQGGTLDLNRAPASELVRLPGVGPRTAARIVEDRALEGPFASVDDLRRVKGIGPKTVARIRSLVSAGPAGAPGS